jgi:GntR family transcriptional regulator / MocR family aminotransferase
VSRTTVTVAYDRLTGEGFVTSRVGSGTFVAEHAGYYRGAARSRRTEGTVRPRGIWDSIALPTVFAAPARFNFRTGASRRIIVSPPNVAPARRFFLARP